MPKISVLLPAYQHERYIAATLTSLLGQQESDLEIIAVDDGSTDRTGEILDDFAKRDSRLRVFHKQNEGVAAALRFALKRASGEWIASCGSDDIVPPGAYTALLKNSAETDIVIGEFCEIDDKNRRTRVHLSFGKSCFSALFAMPAMWNKLIRRDFLTRAELQFPNVLLCEDLILLAQIVALHPRYACVKRDVYHYRNDALSYRSMTHCFTPEYVRAHIVGRETVLRICTEADISEGIRYIYRDSLPFLADLIQRMPTSEASEQAFRLFCAFLEAGQEAIDEKWFEEIFFIPLSWLFNNTHRRYVEIVAQVPHEEFILRKFRTGKMGLQFALHCIQSWASYKLGRI